MIKPKLYLIEKQRVFCLTKVLINEYGLIQVILDQNLILVVSLIFESYLVSNSGLN